jgi:SAM-dependent methyltransferase
MPGFDPATLDFYARDAADYAASWPDGNHRHLDGLLDQLAPGARILELGCGSGRDAACMLAQGFAVEPTDGVPAMAAQAERRLGQPVKVLRFDELDAREAYDAVVACASLLHVPLGALPAILGRIWRALKPGGWHLASYKSGGSDGRDRLGRYYNYLSQSQARACYEQAGSWSRLGFKASEARGYEGTLSPWITVIAQKALG